MDQVFTYKSLVHAIAGMTGGVTAITTFYPLNVVRTRLQVSDQASPGVVAVLQRIVEEEGLTGLYQGLWSAVVSLGASNFVYFYTYNGLKAMFSEFRKKRNQSANIDPVTNLMIASVAGVINVLMTTPLWVVGTRLTVQSKKAKAGTVAARPYTGIWNCLTRIVNEEGIDALWNGVLPSLVLVSNPSIQFVTYENLKRVMLRVAKKRGSGITAVEFFVMGAIAKAVATVLTYPLQVAQSRLRAGKKAGDNKYKGTIDVLRKIYNKNGVYGWFNGMQAKLMQTVLTAAFQFLTYEQVAKLVFWLLLKEVPQGGAPSKGFGDHKGK